MHRRPPFELDALDGEAQEVKAVIDVGDAGLLFREGQV